MNVRFSPKLVLLSAVISLSVAAGQAGATSALSEGVRQFSAGRYSCAVGHLERAACREPSNAMVRYYLATCYVHLNRHEEAILMYEHSYRLDPFGPVSGYCRQALLAYGRGVPDDVEARAMRAPTVSQQLASSAPMEETDKHLSRAISTIRTQAAREKEKHRLNGDAMSSAMLDTGDSAAKNIREDYDRRIKEIADEPLVVPAGGRASSPYIAAAAMQQEMERRKILIEALTREKEAKIEQVKREASKRARDYKENAQRRQAALDETAESLESQIVQSRTRDGAKLRPEGTGLYVRHYGTSNKPLPEVRSSVVRFTRQVLPGDKTAAGDEEQELHAPRATPPPVKSVTGTILK